MFYYDDSDKQEILKLMTSIVKNTETKIMVLDSDFEGIFRDIRPNLLEQARNYYGQNKILQGYFMANNLLKEDIPLEIRNVITELKAL
jgi:hypothetical protein